MVRDKLENRRVALRHVVEAHRNTTLMGTLIVEWNQRRVAVAAHSDRNRHPWDQIVATPVELLPHLKEAMNRIASVGELIGGVLAQLKGTVGESGREAMIRKVVRLAKGEVVFGCGSVA